MGRSVSITIALIAKQSRTFADLIPVRLDIFGLHCWGRNAVRKRPACWPKSTIMSRRGWEPDSRKPIHHSINHESGLADLFASQSDARCALRRQVFHSCAEHRNLLSSDLPRAHREGEQRPLLPERRGCSRSRLSSLPSVPAGKLPRNPGLAGNFKHGFTGFAADR